MMEIELFELNQQQRECVPIEFPIAYYSVSLQMCLCGRRYYRCIRVTPLCIVYVCLEFCNGEETEKKNTYSSEESSSIIHYSLLQ